MPLGASRIKRGLIRLLFLFLFCITVLPTGSVRAGQAAKGTDRHGYTLGIFPYIPLMRLEGTFAPLAAELGRALGRDMHFSSAENFEKFMDRLRNKEFDIAYIQPFDYIRIAKGAGYVPVARRREPLFAVFVVRKGSPFTALDDLKGKVIGMPPREGAMTHLGTTALIKAGLEPGKDITIKYAKEHHSCLQHLAIGEVDACVTSPAPLQAFDSKLQQTYRVLDRTPTIPPALFVVHKRVPKRERNIIRKTLLETTLSGASPELRAPLVQGTERPFIPAYDAEYRVVHKYMGLIEGAP